MEWTYSTYIAVSYSISIGLVVIVFISVCGIFFSSKKGHEFVTDRIIGINPAKAEDEDDDEGADKDDVKKKSANTEKGPSEITTPIQGISVFFCILAAMTLSITAVLIFEGCFLANTRVLPNDNCPEYPMDCFVFNDTTPNPITNNVTFHCDPSNKTQFPSNIPDATAWCYGWIIRLQTTKKILDQLGVCTGLIGLFTALLAVLVYLGKCKKTLILCIIFIACCAVATILLVFFKWSYAPLTYAVLSLGAALGIFGLVLYCIIPKKNKKKDNGQPIDSHTNEVSVLSNPIISSPISARSTTTSPRRTKILQRSSKVTPN